MVWKRIKSVFNQPFFVARNKKSQRLFLALGLFVFLYLFLFFSTLPMGVSVELGRPSPQTIQANREVVDPYTTSELRQQAAAAVPEVFDYDPGVLADGREQIALFFQEVNRVRDLQLSPPEDEADRDELSKRAERLAESLDPDIPQDSLRAILSQSRESLSDLQQRVETIYEEIMTQGIKEGGLQTSTRQMLQEVNLVPFSPEVRQGMEKLLTPLLEPNMIYNEDATQANREAARQGVEPVMILRNSLIIQEGEVVTERHIAQLEALGLLGPRVHFGGYVGLFLILLVIFTVVALYIFFFNPDIFQNVIHLSLLSLILVLTLVLGLAAQYFSGYLMPVAMGGILIAVLLDARLAIFFNLVLALFLGFTVDWEFGYLVVSILGGLVAIYSVSRLKRRSDLTRAGFLVAGVNVVSIIAVVLLTRGFHLEYEFLREFSISLLAGLGSGLFSAVLAIGLLPYLENAFGLTTAVTLLELSDPGRPLLRKLLMETPGTYHHSVLVGNLAEAGAEAIGADPLLSRVAAFYHDIGKIRRPYFFIENQFTGDNPHKKISPNLSALIIRSHVKDGLEMAREENLPQPIIEIIQQHHGTGMISFFYRQAMENNRDINLSEEEFRYEGPLPQSKEAALILLADAVEAAVRSLSRPVAGRVEGMVRRIIKEKLNDGQFDDTPLTLRDLDIIGDTFVHILSGLFHNRIEYPEKELRADLERGKANHGHQHP